MTPESLSLSLKLNGETVTLALRRNARARRISLRVDPVQGGAVLVLPARVRQAEGIAFVRSHADWITDRLAAMPQQVPFIDGAVIPFRGIDHIIRYQMKGRGPVRLEPGRIVVSGRPEHLARRLRDWLREQARAAIVPLVHKKALLIHRKPGRITLRDQKSRWGSCSVEGHLAFNWRLIMAPRPVLDYVVAHEVAHIAQHNHSPAFWRVVERLTRHHKEGRDWLRANGHSLYRYG